MNSPDFSFITEYQGMSLTMIVSSMFIGIIIASIAMLYHQLFLGDIVRRLIDRKALSEAMALTIEELGYSPKNILVKFALRENSTFRKTVHCAQGTHHRFYIPEEGRIKAEIRYRKKGNSIFGIFLTILVFLVVAYVSLTLVPWFTDAVKNIFS